MCTCTPVEVGECVEGSGDGSGPEKRHQAGRPGLHASLLAGTRAVELARGNPSSAAAHLEKGVAGTGTDQKPWRVILAQAYLESNRLGEAVGVLERQVTVHVGSWNPILNRNAHYFLGIAYEKSGWKDKAVQQYQKFLEELKGADRESQKCKMQDQTDTAEEPRLSRRNPTTQE